MSKPTKTRERWLLEATEALNEMIAERTHLKPAKGVYVSAGFPRRDRGGQVIGQCHSMVGANHVFVSPTLGTATEVLPVLLHELIHAADGCKSGHTGNFRRAWKALGFVGKATESTEGTELRAELRALAGRLGKYPHKKLIARDGPAKQGTRMLKVECPKCGYTVRTTQKWLDVGTPTCPCGREMERAS